MEENCDDGKNCQPWELKGNSFQGDDKSVFLLQTQIISNDLLTDKIFDYLSDPDLMKCSLVSKSWNVVCRSNLFRKRQCYLHISPKKSPEDLDCLLNLLDSSEALPFNGISISIPTYFVDKLKNTSEFQATNKIAMTFEKIYEKIYIKNLFISYTELTYLAEPIICNLFRQQGRNIENLHLGRFVNDSQEIFARLVPNGLPNLRTLKLDSWWQQEISPTLQPILLAAPNLKNLQAVICPVQVPMFLTAKKLVLIKELEIDLSRVHPDDLERVKFCGPHIEKLILEGLRRFSPEEAIARVDLLAAALKPSQVGLKELEMNFMELIALYTASPEFLPFSNCHSLTLLYDLTTPWEIFNLKRVKFSKLFPALESVVIVITSIGRIPLDWEQDSAFLFETQIISNVLYPFECSIQNLAIKMEKDPSNAHRLGEALQICNSMLFASSIHFVFPHVRHLTVNEDIRCLNMKIYWPALESFSVVL